MIDFNNQEELKAIKAIKNHPNWETFLKYIDYEIAKLSDLDAIQNEVDLQGRKLAVKTIRKIISFVTN
jgi:hypothetical protein